MIKDALIFEPLYLGLYICVFDMRVLQINWVMQGEVIASLRRAR